jgi:DNA repair exonuclease SbcCD ATPase subunit
MAIFFQKIRWKNFLSTGNQYTEIDLNKTNTTLIVGENGAGKSTLLDALSFSLYNKPFRKVNKPQLVNSINNKDCVVEIEFIIGSNNFKVIRGLKPNKFEIYQNGDMLNQDAASRDYQEVLEKQILKLNHKSFCQVVVVGSASFTPFMQLTAANRREVIEDLLDIQIFSTMNSLLKSKVTDNQDEIKDSDYHINILSEKITMQEKYVAEIQKDTDEQIEALRKEVESNTTLSNNYKSEIKSVMENITSLRESIADLPSMNKKLKDATNIQADLNAKIKMLRSDIKFFEDNDTCPTCKQDIDSKFKSYTVNVRHKQIKETESGIDLLITKMEDINKRLNDISDTHQQIADLNIHLATLNANVDGLHTQNQKLKQKATEIAGKRNDDNNKDIILEELSIDYETMSEYKGSLLKERDAMYVASQILKDGGIKSKVIKQYVPIINKLINKYLASLDFFVNFELDENFNETIKSRFRDAFSYASFSEGEKMRINLAIMFTWRAVAKLRNSASTNLLIMDEVLDGSLDNNGTDEFLKILNTLTEDTNTFIISHKGDQLYDKFTNVIKFTKHKNFSMVV